MKICTVQNHLVKQLKVREFRWSGLDPSPRHLHCERLSPNRADLSRLRRNLIAFDWPAHARSYAEMRETAVAETRQASARKLGFWNVLERISGDDRRVSA